MKVPCSVCYRTWKLWQSWFFTLWVWLSVKPCPSHQGWDTLLVIVSSTIASPVSLPISDELCSTHCEVFCIRRLQPTISISFEFEPLSLLTCFCLRSDFIISNLNSSYHFLFLFLIIEFHPAFFIPVSPYVVHIPHSSHIDLFFTFLMIYGIFSQKAKESFCGAFLCLYELLKKKNRSNPGMLKYFWYHRS